jgi:hypothetical protein
MTSKSTIKTLKKVSRETKIPKNQIIKSKKAYKRKDKNAKVGDRNEANN